MSPDALQALEDEQHSRICALRDRFTLAHPEAMSKHNQLLEHICIPALRHRLDHEDAEFDQHVTARQVESLLRPAAIDALIAPAGQRHLFAALRVHHGTVLADCYPRHRHQADPSTLSICFIERNRLCKVLGAY